MKKLISALCVISAVLVSFNACGYIDEGAELTEITEETTVEEVTEEQSETETEETTVEEFTEENSETETEEPAVEEITEEKSETEQETTLSDNDVFYETYVDVTDETESQDNNLIQDDETFEEFIFDTDSDLYTPVEDNIILGLKLGMSYDEVFEILGQDYEYEYPNYTSDTTTYCYSIKFTNVWTDTESARLAKIINGCAEIFGGYQFAEFDERTGKLINFGYHIGQQGSYEEPIYPNSQKDLQNACDNYLMKTISKCYGEGESYDRYADMGIKSEYIWETEYGEIWLVYGENMWDFERSSPESYEQGINEIVLSCSVPADQR